MSAQEPLAPDEIDPRLLAFIRAHVVTFTRWEIIRFLHENDQTQDTLENLARYVGRTSELIRVEAEEMAEAGILISSGSSENPIYGLTKDPEIRERIGTLVAAAGERRFRMQLVYHILRAGGHT